jgi:CubicO group peptidase (beta-lactamase class C family)
VRIASMTKVFTAVMAMQVRRALGDGGFLDKRLVELLPELVMQSPAVANVTLRHMLSHTAGFSRENPCNNCNATEDVRGDAVPSRGLCRPSLTNTHTHTTRRPHANAVCCRGCRY